MSAPERPSTPSRLRRAWLPAPLLSALLFAAWLMLNGSASAGHVVLGVLFAVLLPWFTEKLRPEKPRVQAWGEVPRLGLVVLRDIVVSNIEVARRILGPEAAIQPGFVRVPLDIRDPHGIVALAGIVTMTPGTLSADITQDRRTLLVHAFNAGDAAGAAAIAADIKARYEAPLMRIFGEETRP